MNSELIAALDYFEREKGIKREILIEAVANALLSASKKSVGPARDMRIDINPKSGEIRALASLVVVERVNEVHDEILLSKARKIKPDAQVGRQSRSRGHAQGFRPHQRPDRQAGHAPAHPAGGKGDDVRRVQGSRGRDRQRHGAPFRAQRRHHGPRQVRGHHALARSASSPRITTSATACAPTSSPWTTACAGRRSSCRAAIRTSCAGSLNWRSARSTTAPWRFAVWRARPATAPRSPSTARTKRWTPSARASGCAARGSRTSCAS